MPPSSPREWLDILHARLHARWAELRVYDAYYEGDQTLAFMTRKFRDAYGGLFKDLTDNYMALAVEAPAERLRVQGFRFGREQDADDEAWAIWQANGLDAESNMVHTEAIKLSCAYWMVQPNGSGMPRITAEHPSQVIVARAPGDRRRRVAALKEWVEDEYIYANVYLPNRVVKYRTTQRKLETERDADRKWETIGAVGNPLGEVPIVPVPNNPSMLKPDGRSDLSGGPVSIQNGVNKLLADLFIGSEYQSYPLRILLGVDTPRDSAGNIIKNAELAVGQARLLMFPNAEARTAEFKQADLKVFRENVDGLIGDLAAQLRIPIYYFRPSAISNLSADALIGLDAGLVSKVNDKKDPIGEAHEDMMRLAFKARDPQDERAATFEAETIWRNTESRSMAQVLDAATKRQAVGVPWEQIMEDIGYSPQQIDRMAAMRETEAFLNPPVDAAVVAQPAAD